MDSELNEILMTLIQKIDSMDKTMNERFNVIDERTKKTDLRLENTIEPNLQLVLEQHSTTAKKLEKLDKIENKLDDVASDVDVIKEVVTQHSGEIDRLKKHA